jgi:hypothetical protein
VAVSRVAVCVPRLVPRDPRRQLEQQRRVLYCLDQALQLPGLQERRLRFPGMPLSRLLPGFSLPFDGTQPLLTIKNENSGIKSYSGFNMNPLVSIIVITHNSDKYIKDTLTSIFTQDYKNIEIIIVDDYSDDNTIYYIQELTYNVNNVKFVIILLLIDYCDSLYNFYLFF